MKTNLIGAGLMALALSTSVALAGAGEIFHPTGGGSKVDIGKVFHNTDKDDDKKPWDEIFNPTPDPVIRKVIDLDPPPPVIHKYIDIFAAAGGAGGGLVDYQDVAKLNIGLKLNCAVAGTPSEFPDDLVIVNAGLIAVPAHALIQWQIVASGDSGIATLPRTLKPGKSIKLNGVLAGGVEAGTACTIKAIGQ